MGRRTNDILEATSYFLAGTFLLGLLRDCNISAGLSDNSLAVVKWAGYGFLCFGIVLAAFSMLVALQSRRIMRARQCIRTYSVFPLLVVSIIAIVATGLPVTPPLTVITFFVIVASLIWWAIRSIRFKVQTRAGLGRLLAIAGFLLLWFRLAACFLHVTIPCQLQVLVAGIVLLATGLVLWRIQVRRTRHDQAYEATDEIGPTRRLQTGIDRHPKLLVAGCVFLAIGITLLAAWLTSQRRRHGVGPK
jgi:hypothetical protein